MLAREDTLLMGAYGFACPFDVGHYGLRQLSSIVCVRSIRLLVPVAHTSRALNLIDQWSVSERVNDHFHQAMATRGMQTQTMARAQCCWWNYPHSQVVDGGGGGYVQSSTDLVADSQLFSLLHVADNGQSKVELAQRNGSRTNEGNG